MIPYKKIIFVCRSNSFSGIMAEAIMEHLQENIPEEDRMEVISRGLIVLFPEPINPKAFQIAENNGLHLKRDTSLPLEKSDITPDSLIITMNSADKKMLEDRYPGILNLYRLRDFSGEGGEVSEPYGGDVHEYQLLFEHLDLMIKLMIEKIWSK